ncbi:PepSY-associated TM helix domain-containing protein [Allosphingosinicella deserti]|uniref:Peptidase n=1 Tax=Allosphingosinicella deserti TaxID=2116704 RepID=A0A2P7QUB0_9SPHN|nr:PepSY domain-containing protein [Sphingomonas deserti]PSJ41553.1 peptidase [Sphingomonas deserti]
MSQRAVRLWYVVHKWTSLVCTGFLLMLCVTGLPLIFHDEIEHLIGEEQVLAAAPANAPLLSLDTLLDRALASRPGDVGLFMSFDEDRPVVNITTGPRPDAGVEQMTIRSYDRRTGAQVGVINDDGVMAFLLKLHTDMFLGLPGMLFLGAMGLLFFVAILSGMVLYAPFMRKLPFGTLRVRRSRRLKWIDIHNLIGIVAVAWMSVVGLTGVINTLADPITAMWQDGQLAEMTAGYRDETAPPPTALGSINRAVETAVAAAPGTRPQFVAFPGGNFSSAHHYAVFLQGATPITKRLLTPALIDAQSGALTDMRPMPWYAYALFLSQPLHFGDYGGLPLKLLWAVLTLLTIVVLGSGLYLWIGRRTTPLTARVREVETGGRLVPAE